CMDVDKEQSMPATKTFSAEMLILGMLVTALEREDGLLPAKMDHLPKLIDAVLHLQPAIDRLAERWIDLREAFVLARGIQLSVSREICCKLQETCYLNATSYAISDFMHGPFAMVTPETHVMLIAMNDEFKQDVLKMISALRSVGAHLLLITDSAALAAKVSDHVLLPPSDIFMAPFASVVAGQLFSCALAVKRGIDPDRSRNIRKVTITK
ncbi:MAG: SIS domain-containing protein, partial [Bacillota bacterium]|nr:SIS domain-containing protein [Bacillota bacterium]